MSLIGFPESCCMIAVLNCDSENFESKGKVTVFGWFGRSFDISSGIGSCKRGLRKNIFDPILNGPLFSSFVLVIVQGGLIPFTERTYREKFVTLAFLGLTS